MCKVRPACVEAEALLPPSAPPLPHPAPSPLFSPQEAGGEGHRHAFMTPLMAVYCCRCHGRYSGFIVQAAYPIIPLGCTSRPVAGWGGCLFT